jgi:hypothetical protein
VTPQESELVDELFNRLDQLETAQRDPEAERSGPQGGHSATAVYSPLSGVKQKSHFDRAIRSSRRRGSWIAAASALSP